MKRIFLAIAFVAMFFSAKAWTSLVDNASYIIARKYMSKQALAEYNRLTALRQTVDYKWVADDAARATLDAELRSTTTDEKDIVVRLEKAVEAFRRASFKFAGKTRVVVSNKVGFTPYTLNEFNELSAKGEIVNCGNHMRRVYRKGPIPAPKK